MSWEDDYVHLGNVEIGESPRGMQDTAYLGAAQRAMRQLRGALGEIAQQHFNKHAPIQRELRSPYKDSTQIAIEASGQFSPSAWSGTAKPQVNGSTRVYKSFKPAKAIVTESLIVTFQHPSLGTQQRAANVDNAADIILVQAFSGADNCFPNAPNPQNGIRGPAFASNAYGNGISWPALNAGIDMSIAFALNKTTLFQVQPPPGFTTDDIQLIEVEISLNLMGPSLR